MRCDARLDSRTGGSLRLASARARLAMEDIAAFLAKTVLFAVLPPAVLPQVARAATRVALAKGEALFEAGTPGDAVYVVRSGLLQIMSAATLGGTTMRESTPTPRSGPNAHTMKTPS